jgi:16S rRNA (guanine966-N2)-methyltransferase
VVFIERAPAALESLRGNIRTLGGAERCRVVERDALHPPTADRPAALVLLDPPYNQGLVEPALEALDAAGWIGPQTLVSVELLKAEALPVPPGLQLLDERTYGKTRLIFLRRSPDA